jgi:hypothetical protein
MKPCTPTAQKKDTPKTIKNGLVFANGLTLAQTGIVLTEPTQKTL